MITLSKLEPVAAGIVPITILKDGKGKVRMTAVISEQARAGWVATFVEDEWPKHSLYCVDVRAEAIARREARKSAARVQRAASARAANTHTSNPPATIVGAL